jgi:hypothetical protein
MVDNVAPNVPTSFAVVQQGTTSIVTWVKPTTNTDASTLKDFSHFEVEAYSDGVTSIYQTGIERFEFPYEYNVTIFGQYKTNVGFRVRAVDQSGNPSAWTTRTFGTDTAPSQPKPPILIKDTTDATRTRLFVRHDLLKNDNTGRLETDVNRIKIYSTNSASSTPTVAGSTLIGTMMVSGDSVFAVSETMTYADWSTKHFFVVAQDIAGNISATSPTAPVSGASTGLFADVAVLAVAYIDYLEANKIKAGSGLIDNITVKSSLIMGATRDGAAPTDADGNAVPITQTVARSANYKYGTDGWIIRGDGYAEFRNLAVNSLNIGKFDQVTQSVMSTKFADFMEDAKLWGRHTTTGNEEETGGTPYDSAGVFIGETNADGAYSARAMLDLTGKTSIRRKSSGLNRGISFEPGQIYKITARIRQLTGPRINAINNPQFRNDTTNANTGDVAGDGVANYWRPYSSIAATNSLVAATGLFASVTTAQRGSGTVAANGYIGYRANTPLVNAGVPNQNALPVVPGLSYSLLCYVKAQALPGTGSTYAAIEWYDSAGTLLSTSTEGVSAMNGTGFWVFTSKTDTAPVGAAFAAPRIRASSNSAGTLTVDFTAAMFSQSTGSWSYFDGSFANSAWSGDAYASPSYETHTTKYRVGVLGFDDAGNLCAADGSTSADPAMHYMVAADGTVELPVFDGTNSQSAGWIEVSGYIKDRTDVTTAPGAHNDPYLPAGVHKNVRFIVPFVQMNLNDNGTATDYVAQLDMFSIESSNTLAPVVLKTGTSKGITIQDIQGDDWSHAIRFYSGNDDERYPGLITELQDADFNQSHTLLISPPQTVTGERTSLTDGMRIRGRNSNLLSNSSFENAYYSMVTNADFENIKFTLGFSGITTRALDTVNYHQGWGEQSIKLTSTAAGNVYLYHHLMAYKFPELLGQTKFTVSAWVRNDPANPGPLNAGFFVNTYDDTGARTGAMPTFGTMQTSSVPDDGEWYRISYTFDFSATFPSGFPDNTNWWDIGFGFVATASGQIFNLDDIQVEVGDTLTTYKPQTPTTYYMPGGGAIVSNTLIVSDRLKSLSEMASARWTPELDYQDLNPSVLLENQGLFGVMEKYVVTSASGLTSSYLALRIRDDNGINQSPFMYLIDGNDETAPNTVQFFNNNAQTTLRIGSNTDPTNAEANAAGKDVTVYGSFKALGAPKWTTVTGLNTGYFDIGSSAYSLSTFNSNGITYMRGGVMTDTGVTSSAVATIAAGHRPKQNVYIPVMTRLRGGGSTVVRTAFISPAGVISWYAPSGQGPTDTYYFFDGIAFSTADDSEVPGDDGTSPATIGTASQPTSLTLSPYASSTTTGTYRVGWVNANDADNSKVRLVWRVDRTPNSATDGNIVTIATVNNAAQSYLLSGLPVGRRIYVKMFAINKSGVINSSTPPSTSRFLLASPTVIYANSSASYRDGYGGMWRNDGDQVYQGEWTGNDNHRGLFFYGTQIYDRLNLGSVARTPTKMTIYMQRTGSGGIYGDVPIDLYPTALATRPSGAPAIITSQTAGANIVGLRTNEAATVTIPSSWYSAYTSGAYKGFAIYNSGSDYAILYGRSTNSAHGKLTIYHKG